MATLEAKFERCARSGPRRALLDPLHAVHMDRRLWAEVQKRGGVHI